MRRPFSGPWLGGDGAGGADVTNAVLMVGHDYVWPSDGRLTWVVTFSPMGWFGLPLINTYAAFDQWSYLHHCPPRH